MRAQRRGTATEIGRAGAFAAIAAAASLAACADFKEATSLTPPPPNPSSPVAAEVQAHAEEKAPIPPFTAIPPVPTDVRSAAAYKSQVVDVVQDRRAFDKWAAAHPAGVTTDETETYAASQRKKVAGQRPVDARQEAEAEAFAKKLREASAPPPPKPN